MFARQELAHGAVAPRTWDFVAVWALASGVVATAVLVPGGLRWVLSRAWLVEAGRVSYGLYMFHEIAFWARDRVSGWVGWYPFQPTFGPVLTLAGCYLAARWSYRHFESRFLRKKEAWTRVPSRPIPVNLGAQANGGSRAR